MSGTKLNDDGLKIEAQDLSLLSPTNEDDNRLFNHDGSSAITLAGGTTTSNAGYYVWDESAGAWNPMKENVEKVGGYTASEIAKLAANESVSGLWDFGQNPTVNGNPVFHGGNKIDSTDLAFDPAEQVELDAHVSRSNPHNTGIEDTREQDNVVRGKLVFDIETNEPIQFKDSDGTNSSPFTYRFDDRDFRFWSGSGTGTVLQAYLNGNVDVPNGDLNVGGDLTVGGSVPGGVGYINGYQSTTQNGVDGGVLANCWQNIEVNSGHFTKTDNNTITVDEDGVYAIDYTCVFHQVSGDGRAIMLGRVRINGSDNFNHTGSRCYIRMAGSGGDQNSVTNHSIHNLNAGDTIEVYVNQGSGVTGHDLIEASCAVTKLA